MKGFSIVSKAERFDEYMQLSKEYDVSFEINDFFNANLLNNQVELEKTINTYLERGIPKNSTMHGAFLDLAIFSTDDKIREISEFRMKQSMEIADRLGLKGVVFHANYNPSIPGDGYRKHVIHSTAVYLAKLLNEYPHIDIYVENMFETDPEVMKGISEELKEYKNYGVCLDWAHVNVYGNANESWVNELYPYVKHMHINDNDLMNDLHLPVGDGKIDWKQFFDYYNKYFKECSVLIETTNPADQKLSLDYIRENLHLE